MAEYNEKQISILDTAERLFASHSYEGTSVRDIAREAEVNVAMISYYFGSKEKLLEALFDMRGAEIKLQIESALHNVHLTPLEKIYKLIEGYIERMLRRQHFHTLMVREQMIMKETIGNVIYETKKRNQELILAIIKEGQQKGIFRKNVDVPLMMVTMVGTANQLITSQRLYRVMNNLEDMPDEAFQKHLKKKLIHHLKSLFKATLTYESKNV